METLGLAVTATLAILVVALVGAILVAYQRGLIFFTSEANSSEIDPAPESQAQRSLPPLDVRD